ncbi:MAG: branched-chain amino acid ABC transporter permease [Alphaproteobacteria bacterium]|nr:branched-chain amino acid ABC transporter permease [Alphaproteobacteria bacterium]
MSTATPLGLALADRRLPGGQIGLWLGALVIVLLLPLLFNSPVAVTIMNQMGISIVFALSYNMLLGQGGMLSFGHAVFFGLGGFMAMHVINIIEFEELYIPLPVVPFIGGLFGMGFAIIVGSFSTRRAGTVFAMISLGVGELVAACSIIFVAFFGGEEGISGDRTMGPPVFGYEFLTEIEVYYLTAVVVFVTALLMYLFSRTPAGRMANAVRDNDERAEFVGYSQRMVRFISFVASGFFAGAAGGLFAINYEILTEENLNLVTSGGVLLMAYIGGIGFFIGPIVGAILLTLLQTVLSNHTELWQLYVGILFVLTVMYVPRGLTGLIMMHGIAFKTRRLGLLIVPYLKVGMPLAVALFGFVTLLEAGHVANAGIVGHTEFHWLGTVFDIGNMGIWALGLVCLLAGGYGTWHQSSQVREAWHAANDMTAGEGTS